MSAAPPLLQVDDLHTHIDTHPGMPGGVQLP